MVSVRETVRAVRAIVYLEQGKIHFQSLEINDKIFPQFLKLQLDTRL